MNINNLIMLSKTLVHYTLSIIINNKHFTITLNIVGNQLIKKLYAKHTHAFLYCFHYRASLDYCVLSSMVAEQTHSMFPDFLE